MKAKILMVVMLMSLSTVLMAQTSRVTPKRMGMPANRHMNAMRGARPANGLNLTNEQKEAFKQGMLSLQKQLQPLRNEIGEAEAHQKTLVTAEKPDMGAIDKNIEKIGALRIEMAKIQTKHRLEMRAQLTEEQRQKFDLFRGKMRQGKRPNGMRCGMM
ncbi:MAG: Spy/CpxP family protein refolding chaperone [Bacteroidetes bacterium]|nr:Spy/CpxP family protein refolding chaperone [Bacteroidota bacterium]